MTEQQNEAAKKALAEEREVSDQTRKEAEERLSKGKPTPTQEENDLTRLGAHITEHEDDGSGPPPHAPKPRSMESKPSGGGYQTRQSSPQRSSQPHSGGGTHSGS